MELICFAYSVSCLEPILSEVNTISRNLEKKISKKGKAYFCMAMLPYTEGR